MARLRKSARVPQKKGALPRRAAGKKWQNRQMRHSTLPNQSRQAQRSQSIVRKRKQRDEKAALLEQVKLGVDDKFDNESSLDGVVANFFSMPQ